jgi:hypothetical protein
MRRHVISAFGMQLRNYPGADMFLCFLILPLLGFHVVLSFMGKITGNFIFKKKVDGSLSSVMEPRFKRSQPHEVYMCLECCHYPAVDILCLPCNATSSKVTRPISNVCSVNYGQNIWKLYKNRCIPFICH